MADINFSCPHCQQHIEAEPGYAGIQIHCPACKGGLVVPGTLQAPAAAPVPSSAASALRRQTSTQPSAPTAASGGCPSCGVALGRGAVLCTNCGYNLATGKRTVAGRTVPLGKPDAGAGETPLYKTIYPYLAAFLLSLCLLYFLGKSTPVMMYAFAGLAGLYILSVQIMVTIAAFKESVLTGVLTFCIIIYAIYFVFKVSENDTLKVLYGIAFALMIGLKFFVVPELK